MKKHLKIIIPIVVVVLAAVILTVVFFMKGEKKESVVQVTPQPTATIEPTPIPTPAPTADTHKGQVRSSLTGLWVSKKTEAKRPFAIMINNIYYAAMNQKGTASADIIYEALAEGGITRMMAIYQDPSKVKQIGSVRSARHYYVSFASEWNAIYCHFGQTKYALTKIAQLGVDNVSGLHGYGSIAYMRNNSYRAPHNVYASGVNMIKSAQKSGYPLKQNKKKQAKHFYFYNKDTDLSKVKSKPAKKAQKVLLPFSQYSTVRFDYNKKAKRYEKYEYGQKHMDRAANKQLAFKNVIIQLVRESNIDRNGYQTMSIHKRRGTGYYCTNGKMIPIEWSKDELAGRMCYYYNKKNVPIKINPGKTYIAVFPISEKKLIKFN